MPNYTFRDKETKEEHIVSMSMSEREEFLKSNPHLEQVFTPPIIGDAVRMGVHKTPESFNQLMKNVKKRYHGSNIETR